MNGKLDLEIDFYKDNSIAISMDIDSENQKFTEVLSYYLFLLRTLTNIGERKSSRVLAIILSKATKENIYKRMNFKYPDRPELIDFPGSNAQKRFTSSLRINEIINYQYNTEGFGILAKGIERFASYACIGLLEYLINKRKNDYEYIEKLVYGVSVCANLYLDGNISITNQTKYALDTAILLFSEGTINEEVNKKDNGSTNMRSAIDDTIAIDFKSTSNNDYFYKEENKYIKWGFVLGIVSVFVGGFIGIIPLATIVLSVLGLIKFDYTIHEKKWKGFVGLGLGILYFILNMYNYGHININNDSVSNNDNFIREYNYVSTSEKNPFDGIYSTDTETNTEIDNSDQLDEISSNEKILDSRDDKMINNVEEAEVESKDKKDTNEKLTIGSTKEEVLEIMGTPEVIYERLNQWSYDTDTVSFDAENRVVAWSNMFGNLKVKLGEKKATNKKLTIGSTKEEVLEIMGTPEVIYERLNQWSYDTDTVSFDREDRVDSWSNIFGNLIVE